MIQTLLRHIRIYKKIFIALGAFVIIGSTLSAVYALEFGSIKYSDNVFDYSKFDKTSVRKTADKYFNDALSSDEQSLKKELFQKAGGQYFILSKITPGDLYPLIQLARVYDYKDKNSYSKAYFYRALEINKKDPSTNYYFGEYYYSRKEYKKALYYYNIAFRNGYKEGYDVMIRMAMMYERLGDLLRANQYYKRAFLIKPNDENIADKIRILEDLRYKDTGYYSRRRKTNTK